MINRVVFYNCAATNRVDRRQAKSLSESLSHHDFLLHKKYVRVSYTAVRQVPALSLFTPTMPLPVFKIRLANSRFGLPYQIQGNPTFSPSLSCETSASFIGSLQTTTMTSADPETKQIFNLYLVSRILAQRNFSYSNSWLSRYPPVIAFSFIPD